MRVESLEQKAAIRVLLYLQKKGEAKITDFTADLETSQHPVYKAKDILLLLGLVHERLAVSPLRRIYKLTDKGQRVATKLQEIEEILQEGLEPELENLEEGVRKFLKGEH